MKVKSESEVAQSCPTLSDPMDYRLPGSSIHRIFQATVLEWVAVTSPTSMWDECNCAVVTQDLVFSQIHILKYQSSDYCQTLSWQTFVDFLQYSFPPCPFFLVTWMPFHVIFLWNILPSSLGFPGGTSGTEPACQCRRLKRLRGRSPGVGWLPIPVFLLGKFHGQKSLVGYSPWGQKESDMTEWLRERETVTSHKDKAWLKPFRQVQWLIQWWAIRMTSELETGSTLTLPSWKMDVWSWTTEVICLHQEERQPEGEVTLQKIPC